MSGLFLENRALAASDFLPGGDDTYDLGAIADEWKDAYIDGTAHIDTLEAVDYGLIAADLPAHAHNAAGQGGDYAWADFVAADVTLVQAITATAAELNLLDLAGLTAGQLLVATGAAAAAWQSTGVKLSAPDISGTVTAAAALTLPGFTLSGNVVMPDGGTIGQAAGPLLTFDDTNNILAIAGCSMGLGTATLGTGATYNLALGGGATSPVIGAAAADMVQLAAVDYAAGDRRLYIQGETGSAIIIGKNKICLGTGFLGLAISDQGIEIAGATCEIRLTDTTADHDDFCIYVNDAFIVRNITDARYDLLISNAGTLTTLEVTPTNINVAGAAIFGGGIGFTDVLNAWIDDATHGNGTVVHYIGNNTINTSAPSDISLKTDIRPSQQDALARLMSLPMVDFRWDNAYKGNDGLQLGAIAQDVHKLWPEIVHSPQDSLWSVFWHNTTPYIIRAIQQMQEADWLKGQVKHALKDVEFKNWLKEELCQHSA